MTNPAVEEKDEPLDPSVERVRVKLIRFMVINLGILFTALMVVVAALVYKSLSVPEEDATPASAPSVAAPLEPGFGSIELPQGATILSQALDGSRLSLHLRLSDETQMLLVYDLATASVIGRYAIRR